MPHGCIMHPNTSLRGKWIGERADVADLYKLIEGVMLDLDVVEITGKYSLDQWKEAWDMAAEKDKLAQICLIHP